MATHHLSIVIPCFNEELVLPALFKRITDVSEKWGDFNWEVLCVDDGSTDNTWKLLQDQNAHDPRWKALRFSRNFGHQTAVTAGIDNASGDAVVIIDADLQDPPEIIPELIEKWKHGYHVVYGTRTERPGESRFKLITAKAFYRFLNRLSSVSIPMDTGDFRLIDRIIVDKLKSMPERDRFIRGMVSWIGFKQTKLLYKRDERFAGKSKYPIKKMVTFAVDGLISFSTKPLKLSIGLGMTSAILAFLGIIYALLLRLFTDIWIEGWTLLMIAVLFMGGVQLVCIGIVGEYIGRLYNEAKRRPLYIVQKSLGIDHFENTTYLDTKKK